MMIQQIETRMNAVNIAEVNEGEAGEEEKPSSHFGSSPEA